MNVNLKKIAILVGMSLPGISLAADGMLDISTCPATKYEINNIETATGWGGHVSTTTSNNGYGGTYAECHLTGEGSVVAYCYDGYLSSIDHVDQFRLDLGPRSTIKSVSYTIVERGVHIKAIKHSTTAHNSAEHHYVIEGFFPLRRESGFCRENQIYYQANGVLNGHPGRTGSGYSMTADIVY